MITECQPVGALKALAVLTLAVGLLLGCGQGSMASLSDGAAVDLGDTEQPEWVSILEAMAKRSSQDSAYTLSFFGFAPGNAFWRVFVFDAGEADGCMDATKRLMSNRDASPFWVLEIESSGTELGEYRIALAVNREDSVRHAVARLK